MPRPLLCPLALLLLAAAWSASAQDFSAIPKLKPGLWQLIKTSDRPAAIAAGPSVSSMCVDDSVKASFLLYAQDMVGIGKCSDYSLKVSGSAVDGASTCMVGESARKMKSAIKFNGDGEFRAVVDATYAPPLFGSMAKAHSDLAAKYVGACPADLTPGDLQPSYGPKLNLTRFGASAVPTISK